MLLLSFLLSWASQPGDLGALKVYRGPNGQRVDVLTLRPFSDDRALLRVSGAESSHDELVLPCQVRRSDQGTRWLTRHDGGDWWLAAERAGQLEVTVPGRPTFTASYDGAASAGADAAALMEAHRAQRASGALRLFERKSYPRIEAKYRAQAAQAIAAVNAACGAALVFELDWASVDDAVMAEVDVWKACRPIVDHLARACPQARAARAVRCRMGPALALEASGEQLVFTTTPAGAREASRFLQMTR